MPNCNDCIKATFCKLYSQTAACSEWQEKTFDNAIKDLEILDILKKEPYLSLNDYKDGTEEDYKFYEEYIIKKKITREEYMKVKNWLERSDKIMTTIDNNNTGKIVSIDKDTAIYVLEKVQEAVQEIIDNPTRVEETILGLKEEFYLTADEKIEKFNNKLKEILNEIKGDD